MKRIFGIIFFIIVFSNPVYAANWVLIGSTETVSVYLDEQSVQLTQDPRDAFIAYVDCWTKFEYADPLDDGTITKKIEYGFKTINKLGNAFFSPRTFACYNSDGEVIVLNSYKGDEWQRIPPESAAEAIYWKVIECIEKRK